MGEFFWLALGRRQLLSTLNKKFSLLNSSGKEHIIGLVTAVKQNNSTLSRLVPLSLDNIQRLLWTTVVACEAPEVARTVVYTNTEAYIVESVISVSASSRITPKWKVPPLLANKVEEVHPVVDLFVRA